jgi:hypothetical protein
MAVQGNARRSADLAAEHVKRSQVTLNLKFISSDPNARFFSKRASRPICCEVFAERKPGVLPRSCASCVKVALSRCQGVKANRASAPLAAPCAGCPPRCFFRQEGPGPKLIKRPEDFAPAQWESSTRRIRNLLLRLEMPKKSCRNSAEIRAR